MDYYGYAPRVQLERPLAVVGFPGAQLGKTARAATMLAGLQLVIVPRRVAHVVGGHHVEHLLFQGRSDVVHEAELEVLKKAGAQSAPPVLALGPTTVEDDACHAWVKANCDVLHLRQTLTEAAENIAAQRHMDPRKHAHLMRVGFSEEALSDLFDARTERFVALAAHEVWLDNRTPLEVGRTLPGLLGWFEAASGT